MCTLFFNQTGAMLRPLPGAQNPDQLVALERPVPYPYFETFREMQEVASSAAAYISMVPFSVATAAAGRSAERTFGHLVSPEYFSTLGVTPLAGRFFRKEMETQGSALVVVVSERFWRIRLAADPQVIGSTLRVNGQTATIIGVGPKDFLGVFPFSPADIFVPVTADGSVAPELRDDALHNRDYRRFSVVLRLASDVTVLVAEAALNVAMQSLDSQKTDYDPKRPPQTVSLMPAGVVTPVPPRYRWLVFGANGLLMAIILSLACANLASLLLVRVNERRREIAIRRSFGASRFRLIRQILTESVVLSLAGSIAGLLLAYWMLSVSESMAPPSPMPVHLERTPALPLVLFTLAVAVVAGIGFGFVPAFSAAYSKLAEALKSGALGPMRRYRRFGVRNLFVVYQVSSSLMLLLITGYMVRGYQSSYAIDTGFDTANLSVFSLDPVRDGYSLEQCAELMEKIPEQLSEAIEIGAVTLAERPPYDVVTLPTSRIIIPAEEPDGREAVHNVALRHVGARYFATLGVGMIQGREFTGEKARPPADAANRPADSPATEKPVVINQTAATRLFGADNPIGRRLRTESENYVVVGVAQDVKSGFLMSKAVPTVFPALTASNFVAPSLEGTTIVVRGVSGTDSIAAAHRALAAIDPDLTVFNVRSMTDRLEEFNVLIRWSSMMNGALGLFGLILACIGLTGVTAHAVARRYKEIGIRMALGAKGGQVLKLVLTEGMYLVTIGTIFGLAGAYALSRLFSAITEVLAQIFDAGTNDPLLVVGAPILLACVALLASYLPARRATRIDPLSALRQE